MTITSNTIVKNGMPYIIPVLEQVAPYMDKMIITLSMKSNDGTREALYDFMKRHTHILFLQENEDNFANITDVRREQINLSRTDWIIHLDDDDYWPRDQLELCLKELDKDPEILSYSVFPRQLIDKEHYDNSYYWQKKSFSKFLKRKGLDITRPFPKDIYIDGTGKMIYWKSHSQVKKLPYFFYHLQYVKGYSFRQTKGFEQYKPKHQIIPKKLDNPVDFL